MRDRQNIQDFVYNHKIKMKSEWTSNNPNMENSRDMDHWKCSLSCKGKRMSTIFSMGRGHSGREPNATEVLNCLVSDATGYENARDFEDWCAEYGYDSDRRKALKTYKAVEKSTKKLKNFLGEDLFHELAYETESL